LGFSLSERDQQSKMLGLKRKLDAHHERRAYNKRCAYEKKVGVLDWETIPILNHAPTSELTVTLHPASPSNLII
jgi:hypothetical protein